MFPTPKLTRVILRAKSAPHCVALQHQQIQEISSRDERNPHFCPQKSQSVFPLLDQRIGRSSEYSRVRLFFHTSDHPQQREGRRLVRKPCLAPDQQVWSRSEKWARRCNSCYRPCFTGYNNIKLVSSKEITTKKITRRHFLQVIVMKANRVFHGNKTQIAEWKNISMDDVCQFAKPRAAHDWKELAWWSETC